MQSEAKESTLVFELNSRKFSYSATSDQDIGKDLTKTRIHNKTTIVKRIVEKRCEINKSIAIQM